jgi:hypothetical protein
VYIYLLTEILIHIPIMKENPHLVFTYPESYSQKIIDEDLKELETPNIEIHVERHGNEVFAAMEWIVPTVFAGIILKPYFEAFFQEAGKDHYLLLKKGLKKMLIRGKETDVKIVAASQSTEKLSKNYSQSLAVSILFQTKTGRNIKLLFDNNLNIEDWEKELDEFLVLIREHYQNYPNDKISEKIKDLSPKQYYTIYVLLNPEVKELEFHDDLTLISKVKK